MRAFIATVIISILIVIAAVIAVRHGMTPISAIGFMLAGVTAIAGFLPTRWFYHANCPTCGMKVKHQAPTCRFCKTPLPNAKVKKERPASSTMAGGFPRREPQSFTKMRSEGK